MRPEYLGRLSESVQKFIREVERQAGVEVEVLPSLKQNDRGPTGQGLLEIVINAQNIQLFAPTNGYFPDGAVRHEILHVQRFHIEADYRQRSQRAVFDAESKSLLAVVRSQLEEKSAEAAYLKSLNERGVVTAPRDGLVLFDDPNQWVGRPVVTGERIMVVADETKVAMEAWLAPADAVSLPVGSDMTLYLASDPLSPVQAHLDYVSHVAQFRPEGQFAYKVRGSLTAQALKDLPRVGMKGTVKLHGESVPLVYRLFRRPWASFRAWVGW